MASTTTLMFSYIKAYEPEGLVCFIYLIASLIELLFRLNYRKIKPIFSNKKKVRVYPYAGIYQTNSIDGDPPIIIHFSEDDIPKICIFTKGQISKVSLFSMRIAFSYLYLKELMVLSRVNRTWHEDISQSQVLKEDSLRNSRYIYHFHKEVCYKYDTHCFEGKCIPLSQQLPDGVRLGISGTHVFLIGGCIKAEQKNLKKVYEFLPNTNRLVLHSKLLKGTFNSGICTFHNLFIYSVGGHKYKTTKPSSICTTQKMDTQAGHWILCPRLTQKRANPSVSLLETFFIFTFGGQYKQKVTNSVEKLNIKQEWKGWRRLLIQNTNAVEFNSCACACSISLDKSTFLIFGGKQNLIKKQYLSTSFKYDALSASFNNSPSMAFPDIFKCSKPTISFTSISIIGKTKGVHTFHFQSNRWSYIPSSEAFWINSISANIIFQNNKPMEIEQDLIDTSSPPKKSKKKLCISLSIVIAIIIILAVVLGCIYGLKKKSSSSSDSSFPPTVSIPEYQINLDESPQTRFNEVNADFKEAVLDLFITVKGMLNTTDEIIGNLTTVLPSLLDNFPEYYGELEGFSSVFNVTLAEAFFFQYLPYAFAPMCSSIIATMENGTIIHAHNEDFMLLDKLDAISFLGIFMKNGTELYRDIHYAGMLGVINGIKFGKFAISENSRDDERNQTQMIEFIKNGAYLVHWVIREALEKTDTYDDAYYLLANTPIVANDYFVISGTQTNQGAIITRGPNEAVDLWNLTKSSWYILETNTDHWLQPPASDTRRANETTWMNAIGQTKINTQNIIIECLANSPARNKDTVYTLSMCSATNYFKYWIWKPE